jgi:hypothetical protein
MQATKFNDSLSSLASINRSIVKGSGLGPVLFIMFAFDLYNLDEFNYFLKYALDVTSLNPENVAVNCQHDGMGYRKNKI